VESFFTAGMAQAMSDLTINESGVSASSYEESWAESAASGGFSFFGLFGASGGSSSGSYDSNSMSAFVHSLSRHAESASRYVAASVRAKSAVSVGEVERRTHAEGESEAHYESSSRMFSNPNRCRAVTYLFYQINKLQRIRFRLVAIERRIVDPAAPTGAYQRIPADTTGKIAVLPQSISATNKNRLEIEQMARTSAAQRHQAATSSAGYAPGTHTYSVARGATAVAIAPEPISIPLRKAALTAVDEDLSTAGILNPKTKELTETIVAELSWKREEVLPTPGVLVKGCLDKCETCEPALQKEIALDLERKQLENQMLKRQIEILEKSQEYRCCPTGSAETVEP
jgi:hypothetical protein